MFGQGFNYGFLGKPPCFTDTTDIFKDNSGIALYTLDYDASVPPWPAETIVEDDSLEINLDATNSSSYSGSGTVWSDLTSNAYNATLYSSPSYTTGNGGAFDFDGSSDYAILNSSAENAISALTKGAIEIWARPDNISSGTGRKTMFGTGHTSSNNRWVLFRLHTSNGLQLSMNNSGVSTSVQCSSYGALNEWNHYVVTYDGISTYKMYINGVPQTTTVTGSAGDIWFDDVATNTLEVAKFDRGSSGSFYDPYDGEIAQIRVYSNALTDSEVLKNYNATKYHYLNYDGTPTDVDFGVGGKSLYGARFNGSSSYIDLGASLLSSKSAFSVSTWVKFDNLNTQNFIFYNSESGSGTQLGFYDYGNGNIYFQPDASTSNNRGYISNSGLYTTDEWTHIVMVFDGSATGNSNRLKAYIQGQSITLTYDGTIPSNSGTSTCNSWIGGRASTKFSGKIDQVRIFNKAISAAEVSKLYGNGAGEIACTYTSTTNNVAYPIANTAYYKLDNNSKDSARSTGKFNEGAIYSGNNGKITINNFPTLTQVGISMWVNIADVTSNYALAARYGSIGGADDREFAIYNYGASNGFVASIYYNGNNGNAIIITGGDYLTNNTWHHIAFTSDGSTQPKLYIDGVQRGTAQSNNNSYYSSSQPVLIGAFSASSAYNLTGRIDQVRIYNTALSSTDVSNLYAETASDTSTLSFPSGKTAIATYQLDGNSTDLSGNYNGTDTNVTYAHDGTINGTVNFNFGRFGQSAKIGGASSDYIDLGTISELPSYSQNTLDFSWSGWVKASTAELNGTSGSNFFFGNRNGSYQFIGMGGNTNANFPTGEITYYTFGGSGYHNNWIQSPNTYDDGNWHHVVVTDEYNLETDDRTRTIFVDTVQVAQDTVDKQFSNSTGITSIGTNDVNTFGGSIDQVRIYSTILDSDQVTELYNEKQNIVFDTVVAPTANLRFDEFWAGYDDGASNRAEFKSSGQIVDFNTNSEGQAVLNQNAQTSGKYYLEIQLIGTSAHDYFGVFNRSSNTVYDVSPYVSRNPLDANYGAGLNKRGERTYIGNVQQSGFTDLNLTDNDIVCMAVDVDEKRIWFGRRDGTSGTSIVWSNGNPNAGAGGLSVSFVPSDVIVAHTSESTSRFSEFKVLNHADMLEAPLNFSYLNGDFTSTQMPNEANF